MENPLDDAETLKIDDHGNIKELGKKAFSYNEIEGQYIGMIKIKKSMLNPFIKFYNQLDIQSNYDGKKF